MNCFSVAHNGRIETFRFGEDYEDGHERLHWTLPGIEKLIRLGLWRREYDLRGRLRSVPPRVEGLIEKPRAVRRNPTIPPLSQTAR